MSDASRLLPAEIDALIRLVRGIVLAQGNVFIKELLRERGIRIGATKGDFENNMIAAIRTGELQRGHIEAWLSEVEGWGNQHVYIYRIPRDMRASLLDAEALERRVIGAGFQGQWKADTSLEYPPERTLTRINFADGQLSFVWHQGREFAIRKTDRDYREEIDGDVYEFRAYRIRSERAVTRFVARPYDNIAAIFVQAPRDEEEHDSAISDVKTVVSRVITYDELQELAIASAIKKLDAASLDSPTIVARTTRLSSAGAYVEFASTSANLGYQDIGPVREVRQAVRPRSFVGLNGSFMLPCADRNGDTRSVRAQLYGEQRRVKLAHRMTANEVWSIIQLVKENV
jgi:hypothetical protein